MTFKKYNSIENHYNVKFLNKIPENTKNSKWVIFEKYDGANLQLLFTPNQTMQVGRRTDWLKQGEKFYDAWNTLKKYEKVFNFFQTIADQSEVNLKLYCELYGKGVQKRIDYGPEQMIKCYDVEMNESVLSYKLYKMWTDSCITDLNECQDFFSDKLLECDSLIEALKYDVELANKDKLTSEGVVIKPFDETVYLNGGERVILKKKSLAFSDKMEGSIDQGKIANFIPEVVEYNDKFKTYINTNRMIDLFSKHGEIQSVKDMGKYIQLLMQDAKDDFNKEHQIPNTLTTKDIKDIFNVCSLIASLLKTHLQESVPNDN